MAKARDYKHEYKTFHGKPDQVRKRSACNSARRKMKALGYLNGNNKRKEVDHINPKSKGGTNNIRNLRVISRHRNRVKGSKRQ